nr:reverse transcriptase domain-containing protein [Tanacetum cinerariifolium]
MAEKDALHAFSMSVVYVLTTPMPEEGGENLTVEQVRRRAKWDNDDYVCICLLLNDFKHTLKHLKEELTLIELGSHLRIEESLRVHDSDKPKGNNVVGPSLVNMVEHNNSSRYNDNKDRCWFKTYESVNNGSILHMGNESTALVHGRGCVDLRFSSEKVVSLLNVLHVHNIRKNLVSSSVLNNCGYKQVIESNNFVLSKLAFMSTSKLNDSILWHARLGHVHFQRMQDMSKDGLIPAIDMDTKKWNKKYFVTFINDATRSLVKGTKDSGGSVVSKRVTDEIVQQSEPDLRKRKRHRTPGNGYNKRDKIQAKPNKTEHKTESVEKSKVNKKSNPTKSKPRESKSQKENKNLFPPLDNPELTIRRRSHTDPTLLNNSEMAAEGNGDLPVPDLRTMEELCQPSLNGRGGPIAPIAIQATNFRLKNDMIQQVHNSCQFHGLPGDDANKHLDKFLHVTQSIKVNGVTDDALRLYLFPHSLTHHATAWFDRLPRNSINTFKQMAKMFLGKYFPPSMVTKLRNEIINFRQRPDESLFEAWERYKLSIDRCPNHNMLPVTQIDTFYNGLTLRHRDTINAAAGGTFMKKRPEECYDLIENMTSHHNDWDTSAQRSESSSSITSSSDTENAALKAEMDEIKKNIMRVLHVNQQVKTVTPNCETCGGPHSFFDCPATIGNPQNVYAAGAYQGIKKIIILRGTTREEINSSRELTKANDAILKNMQTNMTSLTNSNLELKNMFGQFMKMNIASSSGSGTLLGNTTTNPKEDLKERETEVTKDTVHPTNNGSTKDVQPLVVPTESLILNSEPVISPITEPVASLVSAPRPNQRPSIPYPSRLHDQKLRDKANDQREKIFQIFKDLNFNISFADALILILKFGPSIKSLLTNKDKLCELDRTPLNKHCSTILQKKLPEKLGDPGKFLIPCDFPEMAECLALADLGTSINLMPLSVWNKLSLPDLSHTCMTLELTDHSISHLVRVAEDVFIKVDTFHFPADFVVVDFDADPRTSRYSANYNDMTANRIDVINMACEDYSQKVLGFFDVIASGNPTPYYDPIVSTTSPTLTLFGNSDFLLKEVDAF